MSRGGPKGARCNRQDAEPEAAETIAYSSSIAAPTAAISSGVGPLTSPPKFQSPVYYNTTFSQLLSAQGFLGLAQMELELGAIMGRKVDLRTPGELSRYFRDEVVGSALVQYERS